MAAQGVKIAHHHHRPKPPGPAADSIASKGARIPAAHIAAMYANNPSAQASPSRLLPPMADLARDCLLLPSSATSSGDGSDPAPAEQPLPRPKRRKETVVQENTCEHPPLLPTPGPWMKQGSSLTFPTITPADVHTDRAKRSCTESTADAGPRSPPPTMEASIKQISHGKPHEEIVDRPSGSCRGDLAMSRTNAECMMDSNVRSKRLCVKEWGNKPLHRVDPRLFEILEREKVRQCRGIELIASENFASQAVMEALGSHLTNKYSEGSPGARYYGGNEYIDQIETLCQDRALAAFHLNAQFWGVNVQPYSCTSANFAVYTALLQPNDRIMGLDSPSGGHLSHGYYTPGGKKVSAASIFFENLPYRVNSDTGLIDYEKLEEKALDFRPKILICGGSAYPREWDYARFRQIADKIGAILMCDMAHISGLVAAQECSSPFDYCDIVTSTTHKSLRGPRGGMIFYRKGLRHKKRSATDDPDQYDFEDRINFAVFPSLQGGPHNNQIAALAVAFKQVASPEFKIYMQQVKRNAQALVKALQKRGCKIVTEGTDNHLFLWDLRPHGITGYRFEKVCESCRITLNRNAVYGDSGTFAPGGVRIGTLAMTSRGCIERDFDTIADFLLRALQIAVSVQRENGKQQKDFLGGLQCNKDIAELKNKVESFASALEMPGF